MEKYSKRILSSIIIILVLIVPINFAYRFTNAYKNENYEFLKFSDIPYKISFANFGSSHGQLGFYYDSQNSFNFGLSSQRPDYDYKLLTNFVDHFEKNAVLVFPISYFTPYLFDRNSDGEFASQNLRYYHFLNPESIIDYSLEVHFSESFKYLKGYELEKLKYLFNDQELLNELQIGYGNFPIEAWKEQSAFGSDIVSIAIERIDYWSQFRANIDISSTDQFSLKIVEDLKNIVDFCETNDLIPVFVTLPVTNEMNNVIDNGFYQIFQNDISTIMEILGNPVYLDYSHDQRISSDLNYFIDSDHLSFNGAKMFTELIKYDLKSLLNK